MKEYKHEPLRKLNISIAPIEISGFYRQLQIGLASHGHSVTFYNLFPDSYSKVENAHCSPITLAMLRKANRSVEKYRGSTSVIPATFYKIEFIFCTFWLFLQSVIRTDVYIFAWGMSFIPLNVDLLILKLLRKKTICIIGHGSEARPPYLGNTGPELPDESISFSKLEQIKKQTKRVKRNVSRIERWAGVVVALPTTAHFLKKPFVNFYTLGIPSNPNVYPAQLHSFRNRDAISIVHAPSKPEVKGTILIREAIETIQREFANVSYQEVTGVSNSEVLQIFRNSDLIIDQTWSDIPMAMIGIEAASMGIPSITFGNALEIWLPFVKKFDFPIDGYSSPSDLICSIRRLLKSENLRRELAVKQQEFVLKHWNRNLVAENYMALALGTIPKDWIEFPEALHYYLGAGVSTETAKQQTLTLKNRFGPESLCLDQGIHHDLYQAWGE